MGESHHPLSGPNDPNIVFKSAATSILRHMEFRRGTILRVSWVLRIGVAMEFIGHGALGLHHPAAWVPYFALMGISREAALTLMPLAGALDIALAFAVLLYPARAVILYMAAWGFCTALLRPMAGEPVWEAVERAGNFGALLALFLLARGGGARAWLRFDRVDAPDARRCLQVSWVLRLTTVALLLGHGALGLLVRKPLLGAQYAAIGLQGSWVEPLIGGFEIALAAGVLLWPEFGLLVFVIAWKLATEALSPIAGSPIWVFVEHGGSYAAPLALALLNRGALGVASRPLRRSPA
jgi:hypothetical protein